MAKVFIALRNKNYHTKCGKRVPRATRFRIPKFLHSIYIKVSVTLSLAYPLEHGAWKLVENTFFESNSIEDFETTVTFVAFNLKKMKVATSFESKSRELIHSFIFHCSHDKRLVSRNDRFYSISQQLFTR